LRQTSKAWYVVAYRADFADGSAPLDMPSVPTRKFVSQTAAANYVGRLALSRLQLARTDATGTDVIYDVRIQPPRKSKFDPNSRAALSSF
ncbi:MAG TPA: hypothetical protein VM842_00755, partial [Nitrospira sp.]|nr:hypothetical protein [Nitrospira sp.]